jgi:hypothetical protein
MIPKDLFIRNIQADVYLENFLVSAVVSVFLIRIFLSVTEYPILGRGSFHIAHMLWGGFFMLAALFILLSFLSQRAAHVAAVLGGIGFGAFIDELGKFVTSDNNYFFQPTIALIYIIFVLIFLISRFIPRYQEISQREYLVNAIEMIKESAIDDFDVEEERRAEEYLRKCDPNNPIVQALSTLVINLEVVPNPPPGLYTRLRYQLRRFYYRVANSGTILNSIIIFLAAQTAWTFSNSVLLFREHSFLPFSELGQLYSSILSGSFVLIGLFVLRFSKYEAYRYFRISMLITILLTEFFAFMKPSWFVIVSLVANVFVLLVINYAMVREKKKVKHHKQHHAVAIAKK